MHVATGFCSLLPDQSTYIKHTQHSRCYLTNKFNSESTFNVLAVLSGTTVCTGCKRFSHSSLKSEMHCVLSVQYTTYFPTDEGRSIVVPGLPRRAGTPGA